MKKILVDFKFKNSRYEILSSKLKELIKNSPFDNRVYLTGEIIKNQLLGIEGDMETPVLAIDSPNGGVGFATWVTFKTACLKNQTNPSISIRGNIAKFMLSNDPDIGDMVLQSRQTKKYYCHKETRTPLFINGTVEEDAQALGFTIDALYYNVSTGELIDFTGQAFNDLENGVLRATNLKTVFADDPSNILLGAEYASTYGFGFDRDTWFEMIKNSDKLGELEAATVREYINAILTSPKPSIAFDKLLNCNALYTALPYLHTMRNYLMRPGGHDTVYGHTLKVVDNTPADLLTRMGALLHDVGKLKTSDNGYVYHQMIGIELAQTMLKAMGYPEKFTENVCKIVEYHDDLRKFAGNQIPGRKYIRKFKTKCGDILNNVLDVIDSNNKAQEFGKKARQIPALKKEIERIEAKDRLEAAKELKRRGPKLPIDGGDIMKEFKLKQSPLIGKLLQEVKLEFSKNDKMTKDDCFTICEKVLHKIY